MGDHFLEPCSILFGKKNRSDFPLNIEYVLSYEKLKKKVLTTGQRGKIICGKGHLDINAVYRYEKLNCVRLPYYDIIFDTFKHIIRL